MSHGYEASTSHSFILYLVLGTRLSVKCTENTWNKATLITPKNSLSPQKVIAIQSQLKYRELLTKIIRQLVKKSWIKELKKKGKCRFVRAAKFLSAVRGNGMITSSKHTLNVLRKSSTVPPASLKGWGGRGKSLLTPRKQGVRRYGRTWAPSRKPWLLF